MWIELWLAQIILHSLNDLSDFGDWFELAVQRLSPVKVIRLDYIE